MRRRLLPLLLLLPCIARSKAARSVARPALRLGGEWAGHTVQYSSTTGRVVRPGVQALTCERWNKARALERRTVELRTDGAVASDGVLPVAQSGAQVLALGAAMFEPKVLNCRAWALDAVDTAAPGIWALETVFDGLCGDRPAERADAFECPKERTRVQCSFEPSSGTFAPMADVRVWQERCWSVTPADDAATRGESGPIDLEWASSVVGLKSFGALTATAPPETSAAPSGAKVLALDCGVELRGKPGVLEMRLTSGEGARNGYAAIVVRRSWVGEGGAAGSSVFTEVEVVDDTTGDK
jgi:hypothetical protein